MAILNSKIRGATILQPKWLRRFCPNFSWRWTFALFCFFIFSVDAARAQNPSQEYTLKAVFLFNFAQFTEWPTNTFTTDDAPLVIGVLGNNPFGTALEETVANETVNHRKVVVNYYQHVEEVQNCQILFISQSETRRLDKIVNTLKDKPVLTVSDIENSAYRGVCVRFITEGNKIHLRVNTDSLKTANLTMSSKLLRLAEIVGTSK
jgi:hypothetical protein